MLVAQTLGAPFFDPTFWNGILVSATYAVVALAVLFPIAYKIVDWITPGDLGKELLGQGRDNIPNLALGVVVASLFLGFCVILAAAIH